VAEKIIKDSVHGYIVIEHDFVDIINSAEFQRLKYIEQGSFRVLFPAARHDRFIHSLGVYHLARIFADNFINNMCEDLDIEKECNKDEIDRLKKTFRYAALLHDIGHAPFSHTTEKFFLSKSDGEQTELNKTLLSVIEKYLCDDTAKYKRFHKEYVEMKMSPAPHEIMSAILLVKNAERFLSKNLNEVDIELAARMVIGCTFDYQVDVDLSETEKLIVGIKNCFIRLLNSNAVDVDKLDYIKRDTEMSGFVNVSIDIERLARSVTAIKQRSWLCPAFRKNALSVIDNVFRAKTEQGLWVVSHPVVIYDAALLENCIKKLQKYMEQDNYIEKVFSVEGLSREGVQVGRKIYRLVNDIDISADLKENLDREEIFWELYDRQVRRSPVWKSYYEYKHIFDLDNDSEKLESVYVFFKALIDFLCNMNIFVLNDESMGEIESAERMQADRKVIERVKFLRDFCQTEGVKFDFVLLKAVNAFSSKVSKKDIFVRFGKKVRTDKNNYVTYEFLEGATFKGEKQRMFYLYSKEKFSDQNLISFRKKIFDQISSENIPQV